MNVNRSSVIRLHPRRILHIPQLITQLLHHQLQIYILALIGMRLLKWWIQLAVAVNAVLKSFGAWHDVQRYGIREDVIGREGGFVAPGARDVPRGVASTAEKEEGELAGVIQTFTDRTEAANKTK